VELYQDGSRTDSQPTVSRLERLIRRYSAEIAGLRLIARGVSPGVMNVVDVQDIDVASKQQRAATALNFIPMYIILAAFVSGMGIAIDSTAGERERKSLEPLLINPVERFHIVTGKWLAASVFASVGMILTAILCIVAMLHVPLEEVGLQFGVTPMQMATIIFATFPLAFLATSLQLFLGMFAKSFKDAQSYMGLLVILPVAPSIFTLFNPIASQDWMFAVPLLGQQLLLVDLLGGKSIPMIAYFYSAISCLLIGFAIVLMTARLFQRESIITS
jgi:sodium transport system permease protein